MNAVFPLRGFFLLLQLSLKYFESDELEKLHQIHERRQKHSERTVCYERLSLAQKFSAAQLTQFGFQLQFIREGPSGAYAVFICGSNSVTVNNSGEINSEANVSFRE